MLSSIIILVVLFALIFEFINGFHDTANAIATAVYTKALAPHKAIALAAVMNLTGALVSEKVASTISKGIVDIELEQYVILSALIGAILWNLFTWWMGIPSSSSHAPSPSSIAANLALRSSSITPSRNDSRASAESASPNSGVTTPLGNLLNEQSRRASTRQGTPPVSHMIVSASDLLRMSVL